MLNEKNGKSEEMTPIQEAHAKWHELTWRDFHIGTGHGLHAKLTDMLAKGIYVPSVLFDLCAALETSR
ncbi:MAG TPA: hypothetical protein VF427_01080 [Noviherbaspirillum sp.]